MRSCPARLAVAWLTGCYVFSAVPQTLDRRLREVWYDPRSVVTVPVKRGIVTHIVLDEHESITDVGSGLGSDCSKAEASWCIAAQAGGRNIFVKPKTAASAPNNLAVVTNMRAHAFRFVLLADQDQRQPVYRLTVKTPVVRTAIPVTPQPDRHSPVLREQAQAPSAEELIAERIEAAPEVLNSDYSIAEGRRSAEIVPTLVFDNGRFTYLQFPNNRELPAVFHVLDDGSELLVNTRMEGDLLVVDRVSRRLVLRSGSAVVGVWNQAFDVDGLPPKAGSTVDGVERVLKTQSSPAVQDIRPGVKP